MPSRAPLVAASAAIKLAALGQRLRDRRKQLGVNATTTG